MLSDEVIEKVVSRLTNRIEEGNTYIIKKIGESIAKIGTLTPTQAQQLINILKYGGDYNKIAKKLAEISKLNVKDIYAIFEEVAKKETEFAKQFYDYRGKKFIPFDENKTLQNQVKALAKITANEYINLTKTTAFASRVGNKLVYTEVGKKYQDVLDKAVLSISQGKESFDTEMRKTIKELAESGIRTVDYESGRSMRVDSAVRMQMKGALRNLHNEMQQQFGKEFDSNGVEISVHGNPAPDHAEVQGRQFSNEEFDKFQNDKNAVDYKGKLFPAEFEGRDRRSISQYNCYHYVFSIVLGVSDPRYDDKELQQIIDDNNKGFELDGKHYTNYEGTQLQRKLELEIRKQKDIQIGARAVGDNDLIRESQQKITALTNKYKELSNVSGLPTKMKRMQVSGYHKVKAEAEQPKVKIKKQNIKPTEVFISAEENKRINEYFIDYYKKADANLKYMRGFEKERYSKLLQRQKEGYKDEIIKLNSVDDCNKLLERINTKIDGEEIKNTDFRLVQEATKSVYENTLKAPSIMRNLRTNVARIQAKKTTDGVANTLYETITLNNEYFKDYEKFKKMSIDYTELHKYISGEEHNWWSEVSKGNETKEIITHEFGHRLQREIYWSATNSKDTKVYEYFLGKYGEERYSPFLNETIKSIPAEKYDTVKRDLIYEPIRRLQKKTGLTQKEIINKYVSMYGRKNYQEMFAETFANSQLGKSNALGDELIEFLIEMGEWEE